MSEIATPDDRLNIARPRAAPLPSHTRRFLVAFYALAAIWGVRSVWYWVPLGVDLFLPMLSAICLGWWTIADARWRKHPIPSLSKAWFYLFAFFLAPGYVIWSRGWRGLGWLVLHAFGWCLLTTAVMQLAGVLVFGDAWLLAMGGE